MKESPPWSWPVSTAWFRPRLNPWPDPISCLRSRTIGRTAMRGFMVVAGSRRPPLTGSRGRACCRPRFHPMWQVRAFARLHPNRAQSVATQGRRQPLGLLSAGVQDLRRGFGRAGLLRGDDWQGLGSRRPPVKSWRWPACRPFPPQQPGGRPAGNLAQSRDQRPL